MADFSDFRISGNIEDRRREKYRPQGEIGAFGTYGEPPNVFDMGHGTLVGLNPDTDFVTQPEYPSQLSINAGVNDVLGLDARLAIAKLLMGSR